MNDLRQAAEQALEALRYTCDYLPAKTGVEREVDDAITALCQALAMDEQTSLELCDRCGWKAIAPPEGCLICDRKKWVGLTDKERPDWHAIGLVGVELVAAHLEEKNG